jgi:hypothetical protein
VAYSKRSVSEQQSTKYALERELRLALFGISKEDIIALDTGDGVAITFLNDIERAYSVAVELRKYLSASAPRRPVFEIRTGINLGPLKIVIDINERMNVIGDGINVAQRIMSFASPGQLLISSSYYDMMRMLKPEYERTFISAGRRWDKHARDHLVYEACLTEPSRSQRAARGSISERLRANRITKVPENLPRALMLTSVVVALLLFVLGRSETDAQAHDAVSPKAHKVLDGKAQGKSHAGFPDLSSPAFPKKNAKLLARFGRT